MLVLNLADNHITTLHNTLDILAQLRLEVLSLHVSTKSTDNHITTLHNTVHILAELRRLEVLSLHVNTKPSWQPHHNTTQHSGYPGTAEEAGSSYYVSTKSSWQPHHNTTQHWHPGTTDILAQLRLEVLSLHVSTKSSWQPHHNTTQHSGYPGTTEAAGSS